MSGTEAGEVIGVGDSVSKGFVVMDGRVDAVTYVVSGSKGVGGV